MVRAALVDPDIAVDVEPFGPAMGPHFEMVSTVLADPFDSAIVATASLLVSKWLPTIVRSRTRGPSA